MTDSIDEFELKGIETIARGVCLSQGQLLLCRAKGGRTTYLPGGHIEFGETGREALAREIKEELGCTALVGKFLGVVENTFVQHGQNHAEINLVYELKIPELENTPPTAQEKWIEFEWRNVTQLDDLLPAPFRAIRNCENLLFEA